MNIEEIKCDNIPIQDYGTPNSRTSYSSNYNMNEDVKIFVSMEHYLKMHELALKGEKLEDKIRNKIKECEEIEKQLAFIQNESYARKRNKDFIVLLKDLLKE